MSHKMSVKKIRGMVNSAAKDACKSLGIGTTPKPRKGLCADGQPKAPAFERAFQKIQKIFDEAQVKFHNDSRCHLVSATKALALVQKRYTRAFLVHQKKVKAAKA